MASLHPGVIFTNAGFNRRSTPVPTNEKGGDHISRTSHENPTSPRISPVARIYDVSNSSSRLILLNNKLSNSSSGSRLKGQTDYKGEIKHPEPKRHFSASPYSERHKKCWYTKPERKQTLPSLTRSASTSSKDGNKASYSSKRTTDRKQTSSKSYSTGDAYSHADYKLIRLFEELSGPPVLPIRRKRYRLSPSMSAALGESNLKHGERHYLSSIADIYGVERLRQQKFMQYNQLMWKQLFKGYCNLKNADKYFKYMTRRRYASQKRPYTSTSRRRSRSREKNYKGRTKSKSPSQNGSPGKNNHKQREGRGKKAEAKNDEAKRSGNISTDESEKEEQSSETIHKSNNSVDVVKDKKDVKSKFNDKHNESQQQSKSDIKDWVESSEGNTESEDKDVPNNTRNRKDSFFDEDTESISKESNQREKSYHEDDEGHEDKSESDSSSSDSEEEDNSNVVKEDACSSDEVHLKASESEQKEQSKDTKEKLDGNDLEKQSTTINLETDSETVTEIKDDIPKETKCGSDKASSSSPNSEQENIDVVDIGKQFRGDQEKEYETSKVKDLESTGNVERESETNIQKYQVTADVKISEISQDEMTLIRNNDLVDNYEDHSSATAKKENDDGKKRHGDITEQSSSTEDSSLDSSFDSSDSSDDSDSETGPQSTTLQEHK